VSLNPDDRWLAHPASNIAATISDRNFMHLILAGLTLCALIGAPRMKIKDITE
jgi:hypothetical protein